MIRNHLGGASGRVLDCACGTGLTGAALHEIGFQEIVGADISTVSLEVTRAKNVYTDLHEVDLQALPIGQLADDSFDAVQCVAAMAFIEAEPMTHIEIPAGDGYLPFYNPGGPGPEPTEGVRYTAPGPPDLEPIINALDGPMRVSYGD